MEGTGASVIIKRQESFRRFSVNCIGNRQVRSFSHVKTYVMPIVKVIEVIASSEKGIDEAIKTAVAEASKTIRNIDSVYVKDIKAHVKDGKISTYGVVCNISFRVD